MNHRKFTLKLDLFTGFYESVYLNSDTPYWAIKEELDYYREVLPDLTEMDLDFDYEAYCKDVTEAVVDAYKELVPDGLVEKIVYDHTWSPKYYNYSTDEIYCQFTLAKDWKRQMREFIEENKEWLDERIQKDWTSYDGFISFMENRLREWGTKLFIEEDTRYIGTMLTYMMIRADKYVHDKVAEYTLEDIYEGSYVKFVDKEKEDEYYNKRFNE